MPLLFPIADTPRAALDADGGVRSLAEATVLAGRPVALVSDWLRPAPEEAEAVRSKAEAALARGFVQIYEDAKGQPVIAVSYWKPQTVKATRAARAKGSRAKAPQTEDHTDDLYFNKRPATQKRRKRTADPNQLDLFTGPDQKGHESPDPLNPAVVIVEEEGDGAAFGLGAAPRT